MPDPQRVQASVPESQSPSQFVRLMRIVSEANAVNAQVAVLLYVEGFTQAAIVIWQNMGQPVRFMPNRTIQNLAAIPLLRHVADNALAAANHAETLIKEIEKAHGTAHRN